MNFEYWRHTLRGKLLMLVKNRQAALAEYRAALLADPGNAGLASYIAYLHASEARWNEAVPFFETALRLRPDDAIAWFNLGFAHDAQGRRREAIAAFDRAVRLKPTIDRAWYGKGMAHAALGEHAEAAAALERAAELQPMNGLAWYALGMAHHTLHNPDKVKEIILHLHRFDPNQARKLISEAQRSDLHHLIGT